MCLMAWAGKMMMKGVKCTGLSTPVSNLYAGGSY